MNRNKETGERPRLSIHRQPARDKKHGGDCDSQTVASLLQTGYVVSVTVPSQRDSRSMSRRLNKRVLPHLTLEGYTPGRAHIPSLPGTHSGVATGRSRKSTQHLFDMVRAIYNFAGGISLLNLFGVEAGGVDERWAIPRHWHAR